MQINYLKNIIKITINDVYKILNDISYINSSYDLDICLRSKQYFNCKVLQ